MRGSALLLTLILVAGRLDAANRLATVVQNSDAEAALKERVTRYWEARTQSNLVAAYPFYEPAFRTDYSLEQFLSSFQRLLRFRPQFLGIEQVRVQGDRRTATVQIRLRTKPEILDGTALDSLSEETWLLIDGVWYRQREALIPTI